MPIFRGDFFVECDVVLDSGVTEGILTDGCDGIQIILRNAKADERGFPPGAKDTLLRYGFSRTWAGPEHPSLTRRCYTHCFRLSYRLSYGTSKCF